MQGLFIRWETHSIIDFTVVPIRRTASYCNDSQHDIELFRL